MKSKKTQISDYNYGAFLGKNLSFAASEAYKLLRTNLMFALADSDSSSKVIGMTSSVRGEGKSTTALNLAYSLAEAGMHVLIIEADLRLPTICKRLRLNGSRGISNLLVGMSKGSEVIQPSGLHENLWVLPAGDIPPNPSELLGSERMQVTIEVLQQDFDFILLDLPPVTAVSDPLVVSSLLDGMILVVRQDYSNRRMLAETVRQLKFSGVKILGFVMNSSSSGNGQKKYYKKYGYGYGYGDNGGKGSGKA